MTVEIRIAQNADAKEWDNIISESPHGTIFHHWNWLKITEKHTKTTLYPVMCMKNGITIGLIPLFFQKKGLIRMVFSPPPFTSIFYLGPIIINFETMKQDKKEVNYCEFLNSIENFIGNNLKANYISISLPPDLKDPRPFGWSGYSIEPFYDYRTDLTQGSEQLYLTISNKQRQNLNRAKRRGITVEIGGKKEYETILNLMVKRYTQQGKTDTVPRKYLMDIYEAFPDRITIVVAKYEGRIITGSIDIHYKDTIYSWIGNPKPINFISPSPNDLVIWESIRLGCEQGFHYYVTMSAAGNKRLYKYYSSKFDPELSVRFSVKKHSFFTGILEKGYTGFFKSLTSNTNYLSKKNAQMKHELNQESD